MVIYTMINESFTKVGVNKLGNNFMALIDAQDLTNEYADVFRVTYDNQILEGLISSVHIRSEYFRLQMLDGTATERLDIDKLEKIEKVERWDFDIKTGDSFKIYVDDLRSVPSGYIGTKSVKETVALIEKIEANGGTIECLDLDHDLGEFAWLGGDAIKILDYLVSEEKFYKIFIHTANPVGKANMERMIKRYWP